MKYLITSILFLFLVACNSSDKGDGNSSAGTDLSSLPVTLDAHLFLSASSESGAGAIGYFNNNGEEVSVIVSKGVGVRAGIDTDQNFAGKVKMTIAEKHNKTTDLLTVYSVSELEKQ